MKENYQIYLPYQCHWRAHLPLEEPQLPHKKMKTLFLSNMSKSWRLTSTFFPTISLRKKEAGSEIRVSTLLTKFGKTNTQSLWSSVSTVNDLFIKSKTEISIYAFFFHSRRYFDKTRTIWERVTPHSYFFRFSCTLGSWIPHPRKQNATAS